MIVFIIFTILFNIMLRDFLESKVTSELTKDSQIIAEVVNTDFTRYDEIVRQMLTNAELLDYLKASTSYSEHQKNPMADRITSIVADIQASDEDISLVWLGSRAMNGIITPDKMYVSPDWFILEQRPWYTDMLLSDSLITHSQPYVDVVTGDLIISIVAPVYDGEELIGNVGLDISLKTIKNFVQSYSFSENGYAFLLYKDGQYIVHPNAAYVMNKSIFDENNQLAEIGSQMLSGSSGIVEYVEDKTDYYVAYSPIKSNDWSVGSVIPKSELRNQLMILNIMSLIIIIAEVIILIGYIFNQRLSRDFSELKKLYADIQEYSVQLTAKDEYIKNLAYLDPLTGIANRRRFLEYLENALSSHHPGAVIMVDLDNFKEINDTMGHVFGDKVLQEIVGLLMQLEVNEHLKISRFGGDEFLVLIDNIEELEKIDQHARDILKVFSEKIIVADELVSIGVSMGISLFPNDSRQIDQLIMNADLAMYRVKRSGRNNYLYFDKSMTDEMMEKTRITSKLKGALTNGGFTLLYQPQVDVETCSVFGFEALIRLKSNEYYPQTFIPVAEEDGSIIAIGRWVVNEVVTQLSHWREKGLILKPVAINFSAKQMEDSGFADYLDRLLKKHDLSPELIEIEITETAIMENKEEAMKVLDALKAIGVHLSLDDFGTGYSSLSYLTFMPIDKIKLDKSLCDRYLETTTQRVIENLIDISHTLGMQVVAEGIEDSRQFQLLKKSGCDFIQGYLFSKPVNTMQTEMIYDQVFEECTGDMS
ncbi:EAL domain-containing protein [Eubacteriaceae bacterium ES3]|nr:EAL domain-containing protein [Eubacteriaceae bacterium ES3]